MADIDIMGYKDQEVLVGAVAKHVSSYLKTSEGIIRGKIRMAIEECYKKYGKSFKELKFLPAKERDAYAADLTIIFIEKMNLDINKRRTLKYDCLQIYERWKSLKRLDQADDAAQPTNSFSESETADKQNIFPDAEQEVEEENLLEEFNSLDLDGLV